MKLRDMMFLVIGGLLVISGMVLNTLISGDADAQEDGETTTFRHIVCRTITCEGLFIQDENGRHRGRNDINDWGKWWQLELAMFISDHEEIQVWGKLF